MLCGKRGVGDVSYVCGITLRTLCHYYSRYNVASIQARVAYECKGSGNLQRVFLSLGIHSGICQIIHFAGNFWGMVFCFDIKLVASLEFWNLETS